ncbi:MAG TPA: IS66 family insertion sequence element accessory protein TnpB [Bacteroidia bacterium]|nr:IS66 family insertion sequence element accessory protein TnpB [Bacteroidia bacterium]
MKSVKDFYSVYIHKDPVDMRRGIHGLCDLVQFCGMGDLAGKNLFVFTGRRRDLIKVLYFDRSGFCLWQKRLEKDRFPWPKKISEKIIFLSPEQFAWLLDGYDVWKIKPFASAHFERVS